MIFFIAEDASNQLRKASLKQRIFFQQSACQDDPLRCPTTRSPRVWTLPVKWSLFGVSAFSLIASQGWKNTLVRVAPGLFPPDLVVQVKALACELPAKYDLPLSGWSTRDLVQEVQQSGLVASVSGSTLWRWLQEDAIRPWDPPQLDIPARPGLRRQGRARTGSLCPTVGRQAVKDDEFVISADEKTSIQARRRKHATQRCRPRTPMHVEHEYFRCGAWTYIAALDGPPSQSLWPLRNEEWYRTI